MTLKIKAINLKNNWVENKTSDMNEIIENLYQAIGQEVYRLAPDLSGKLLLYSEVEDGVTAPSLFYEKGLNKKITYKFCSNELAELIYDLWDVWNKQVNSECWAAISYMIESGKFSIDLTYPEQMKIGETFDDRQPVVIESFFGKKEVDYSNPD